MRGEGKKRAWKRENGTAFLPTFMSIFFLSVMEEEYKAYTELFRNY